MKNDQEITGMQLLRRKRVIRNICYFVIKVLLVALCSIVMHYLRDEVKILKELGRGNFGVVSSGRWRDTDVAIKVVS